MHKQIAAGWSNLQNTLGTLSVVNDVDLDNNGIVDGADFLAIQQTNPNLIGAWKDLYGKLLIMPTYALTGMGLAAIDRPTARSYRK